MTDERTNRRLAAIMAADVVGYSRMMATDETGTLTALKRHRETLFDPAVAQHNGRIVKLIGDGTLAEFASVVDAVKCALAIQGAVNAEVDASASPNIVLRIGVNLGDIIIDGDDIYGDGVNVAARLEPLAEPGGICVASIVNESVGSRIEVTFKDGGEVKVKNIDRPIRVWKWHPGAQPAAKPRPQAAEVGAQLRATPSIAVLPFDNMSGDAEQEYFSDGITEDVITDLSKVGGLMVIARNSSFAYKGKTFDIRTVARELGVGSVLEGSIRKAGNRVRITAQLIDSTTGGHLWAERYDRDLTDIFAVQDDVTRQIVEALKVTLTPGEQARIEDSPTTSVEAHDCFLRARELVTAPDINRERFEEAVSLLNRAIELDPGYAAAHAGLALTYVYDFHNRWTEDPDASMLRADALATKAIGLDPNEPLAHFTASITAGFRKDNQRSGAAIDKALALNPNYAPAHNARGAFEMYGGKPEAAIPHIERAMRLDPGFSQQYLHFLGLAHLLIGNYETAAAMFKERSVLAPETDASRAMLASTLGHLGETEEARRIWRELKEVNPRYVFADHIGRLPFQRQADIDTITAGLAKAGLPD